MLVKILQKILPRTLKTKSEIEFYKIPNLGKDFNSKNFLTNEILLKIAVKEKISHIMLSLSPLIFPSTVIKKLQEHAFRLGLTPHIPLSGIESGIFINAKEIGLEKYIPKIEKLLRTKIVDKNTKKVSENSIRNILKNRRIVTVKLGPNVVHEILDSLEVDH